MFNTIKDMFPRGCKRFVKQALQSILDSIAYINTEKPSVGQVHHIVFVCKGNICRSPFAEYYLRSIINSESLNIESCGLDVDHGNNSPPVDALQVAREFGVNLSEHHSKGIAACDVQNADLIIPMEYDQYVQLTTLFPEYTHTIRLLQDFSPFPERLSCNVYDPYGLGKMEFRRCFRKMQRALGGLKEYLSANRIN